MGGSPPHFEGKNFAYWKVRMATYLDAVAPEVWLATKTGFTGTPTSEQLKWNANGRNAIFEAISEEVFARVNGMAYVGWTSGPGFWRRTSYTRPPPLLINHLGK